MAANANSQTITSFSNWLKDHYLEGTQKQFYASTVLLDMLRKEQRRSIAGNQWVEFIHTGQNTAVAPFGETDYLSTPSKQTINRATFVRKSNNARAKISGWLMDASAGDMAAAEALNFEMKRLVDDLSEEVNRQLYGDGGGKYCKLDATNNTAASSTITVYTESTLSGERGTADLKVGQEIAIVLSTTGVVTNGIITTVESITNASTFVTVASTTGNCSNYWVVPAPGADTSGGTSGWADAIFGLNAFVRTANLPQTGASQASYGGIAAATNTFWQGVVETDSATTPSRPLSLALLWSCYNKLRKNGSRPNLMVSDYEQWTNYGLLHNPSRRTDLGVRKLDSGWEALEFNGIPWVADKACPPNTVFMLDLSTIKLLEERAPSFMNRDGSAVVRVGSGSTAEDAYEMSLIDRRELVCNAPFRNGKIVNLQTAL